MRKVIVVGMFDSSHFVGWLRHFADEDIHFMLFPSSPHRRIQPGLKSLVKSEKGAIFRFAPAARFMGLPVWLADQLLGNRIRSACLRRLISNWNPDFVHVLELQNAGYIASRAFDGITGWKPILIATNYGSDIYWFARQDSHRARLVHLLKKVDRYAAECLRDVDLARSLGYRGAVMKVNPNAGGFERTVLDRRAPLPSSKTLIMVKGYQGWVGRAHIAIASLEVMAADLKDYEIVFYSCNLSTMFRATRMAKRTGLRVRAYPKGALSNEEMLDKFSRALVYVGLSLSDGISTSMLEAMAMGAIPVQTSTSCCDEWFSNTGIAIHDLDPQEVAKGIRAAIKLAVTTDSAARNKEIIRSRASQEVIAEQALSFYTL